MDLLRRGPDHRRRRALRAAAPGPLADHLAVPPPPPDTLLGDLPLLALDLETTGLDPRTDRILSLGWVPVDGEQVVLSGARRLLVRDLLVRDPAGREGVGQSATVHGITDDDLVAGASLEEAVGELLGALAGRVLLAHYARVETGFVAEVCRRSWGAAPAFVVVDTLELERRSLPLRFGQEPTPGVMRLAAARARRGLPTYLAHEALTDALACAELYLAQCSELAARSPGTTLTLRQVVA